MAIAPDTIGFSQFDRDILQQAIAALDAILSTYFMSKPIPERYTVYNIGTVNGWYNLRIREAIVREYRAAGWIVEIDQVGQPTFLPITMIPQNLTTNPS